MRVLLINPPASYRQPQNIENYSAKIPLGLAYIAAVLEKYNHHVMIYDAPATKFYTMENGIATFGKFYDVANMVYYFRPDIVGISCLFNGRINNTFKTANIVKSVKKDVLTFVGGIPPTTNPHYFLDDFNIDFVALGESDFLINDFWKSRLEDVDGIAYKYNGEHIIQSKTKYIKDLDIIPFPARHLLPMEHYMSYKPYKRENQRLTYRLIPRNSILTSRGCPYNCSFCTASCAWGKKWRTRRVEDVLEEMSEMRYKYGMRQISIEDDNFTIDKQRLIEICDGMVEKKFNFKWDTPNGVAMHSLDEETLPIMKRSGLITINLAIESADQNILKQMGKEHWNKLDKIENIISICHHLNIKVISYFLIGIPGETKQSIQTSIDFAVKNKIDQIMVSIVTPYEGTRLYDECKEDGYLTIKNWNDYQCEDDYHQLTAVINTPFLSAEELANERLRFYNEYNKRMGFVT